MYRTQHFALDDPTVIADVVRRRGAGTLVVASGDGFEASLLPWVADLDADGNVSVLRGHVARRNPLVDLLVAETPGLVLFDVADGYVSPSWYPSKAAHGRAVPTWNYVAVHAHGSVRCVDDPGWVERIVRDLTAVHEAGRVRPWAVDDAPPDFLDAMLRGIVGVEVRVTSLEGKAKLSQNRDEADRRGVLDALADEQPRLAEAMQHLGAR